MHIKFGTKDETRMFKDVGVGAVFAIPAYLNELWLKTNVVGAGLNCVRLANGAWGLVGQQQPVVIYPSALLLPHGEQNG